MRCACSRVVPFGQLAGIGEMCEGGRPEHSGGSSRRRGRQGAVHIMSKATSPDFSGKADITVRSRRAGAAGGGAGVTQLGESGCQVSSKCGYLRKLTRLVSHNLNDLTSLRLFADKCGYPEKI